MVPRAIIERIFEAATIQRWNDRVRPVEMTELDKQAHKAMIAFLLARFEEDRRRPVDWTRLIEGFLFEFFPRVVLTDIKAPFFHRLVKSHGAAVNRYVLQIMQPELTAWDPRFADRFAAYLDASGDMTDERRILKAAHYLASQWEFRIIYHANPGMYAIEDTKREIENQLEDFIDLIGVRRLSMGQKTYGFVDLCGQLRFQERWAQMPRLPRTAVLGHSLFVAALAYMIGLEIGACDHRRRNDFFGALFHDLPEVFTRDIVSPVKRSIADLERFVEQEERAFVRDRLLPLLPDAWHSQMIYYIEDPFRNKVRVDGRVTHVSAEAMDAEFNRPEFDPLDGEIIRGCDELAAFVEATKSIENGVNPPKLVAAAAGFVESASKRRTGSVCWGDYVRQFQESRRAD